MPSTRIFPLALTAGVLLAACASNGAETSAVVSSDPGIDASTMEWQSAQSNGEAYTLMVLRSGQTMPETREHLAQLTTEHTEFVEMMTNEGFLLCSGPMVPPRVDETLRGMFICDSQDVDDAYARACADPASEAGVFAMEAIPFVTSMNLRAMQSMDRESAMMRSEGGPVARPYIVVAGQTSPAMDVTIDQLGDTAIFSGHCVGGSMEGVTLCVLDCTSVGEARNAMSLVSSDVDMFEYHPWVTSTSLANMNDSMESSSEMDAASEIALR